MKEEFYFTLFCDTYVSNTYVGSRSNAKAYFKRWVRKNFPNYDEYVFTVCVYETMYDMLHNEDIIRSYRLSLASVA